MTDTAVVINGAAPLDEEEQLVARRTAAVLLCAGADLLVARSERTGWEVGLPGHYFEADDARSLRREVLAASLAAAGAKTSPSPALVARALPSTAEQAWLDAAGGNAVALQDAIRSGGYRKVVLIGLASSLTVGLAEEYAERAVVVPLKLPRHAGATRAGRAVAGARRVVGFRSDEHAELASVAGDKARDVGFALRAVCDPTIGPPSDAPQDPYVLLLGRWSDPRLGGVLRRRAARLARRLTSQSGTSVVLLTEEFVYPDNWPAGLVVRPAGSRRDLWRWMSGAVAVVDLDGWRYLARDVAEALLCGAAVVVPEGSAAHDHVKMCGGGVWYRHHGDVAAAVDALCDDHALRRLLTNQSRARAHERFDEERFRVRMLDAVASIGG